MSIITERRREAAMGRYSFVVAKGSTKPEIRQAVEELFQVKVVAVNTANYSGKFKRVGVHRGLTPSYKKAVVTIDMDPADEGYTATGGKKATTGRKYKTAIEEFGFGQ